MSPVITRNFVRDLSEESYGNAVGIGLADMVTRRLVDKIEYKSTYINAITSTNVEAARIPVTFDSEQDARETAILTSGAVTAEACRLVLVKNTLKLDQFIASEALLDDIRRKDTVKVLEDLGEIAFTEQGNLSNLL